MTERVSDEFLTIVLGEKSPLINPSDVLKMARDLASRRAADKEPGTGVPVAWVGYDADDLPFVTFDRAIADAWNGEPLRPVYAHPSSPAPVVSEAMRHAMNEACDALCNGIQMLRNLEEPSMPNPAEYRAQLSEQYERVRGLCIAALGAQPAEVEGSAAARDVLAERERQKSVEGWTAEHDDQHTRRQMAAAAGAYAWFASLPDKERAADTDHGSFVAFLRGNIFPSYGTAYGGWDTRWWKPSDRRRDLVKAGALLLAEIERLDRTAALAAKGR